MGFLHFTYDIIITLIVIYTVRHYVFTLNRLFGKQRHPYIDIDTAKWPTVTVLVAAHNEEVVIRNSLEALVQVNYPDDRIEVVVVNDRSKDKTGEIVEEFVKHYPQRVKHFDRKEGKPGKAPALKDACQNVKSDIIIVFDADYIPGKGLVKQLASPFFDPEVGLVMGRVVPINTGRNLLTRLLDMERAAGYQVDQQARMNMGLLPQYGGTVGGIRREMLDDVGGWLDNTLAEDTDITYRALLRGWKTIYQNRSECYEEVPETWPVRIKQIMRWAKGHNQSLWRYSGDVINNKNLEFAERLDAMLLLGIYMMPLAILLGWLIGLILFYSGDMRVYGGYLPMLAIVSYSVVGNTAAFFQISAAVYLDGGKNRMRLLPFNFFNFTISAMTVSYSVFSYVFQSKAKRGKWDKTERFRKAV
ncbi:MAG: glycosyltransferase family 2 protein [Proteobacteria bacterium]|nr:glycosyltransferase family 2 protein [Pseudomonadota bacterium]